MTERYDKERSREALNKYYEKIGQGDRSFFVNPDVPLYKMPVGEQSLRILPSIEPGEFFGEEIWVHEWVGMNKDSFLCMEKMKRNEDDICPFCEQAKRLSKANASFEELLPFKPRKKVLLNVVDLKAEKDGTKVWIAPFTVVDEILLASYDRKAKTPRDIADPDEGHDIYITRDGDGKTTKYKGIQMDPSPTSVEDAWLDNRFDLKGILIYPSERDMISAIESMAGAVEIDERPTPSRSRTRGTGAGEEKTPWKEAPPVDVPEEEEKPIDLKEAIGSATRAKYGEGGRTRS